MAQLTITIDNTQVPRVLAAFTQVANSANPPPNPPVVVDQAWVAAYLKQHIRAIVREYERYEAERQARAAIVLPPDIT